MKSTRVYIIFITLFLCSVSLLSQSDRFLHFDGIDDFAETPNASQYFTNAPGISMTGWFCTTSLGYGHGFFGFRGPGNGAGQMYVIELGAGNLECRYISTTGFHEYVSPNNTVQAGVWQHVAWIYTGTQIELYLNGVFNGSVPASGVFATNTRSFGIGKSIENGFNFVFGGRIDEVSVWRKALTQTDVLDIMENELLGNETDLELYYKMNQGIPGGDNTAITELISEVGGGTRNAMLNNFSLNGPTSNFNQSFEDPSFTVSDFCVGAVNQATITGTPGGFFSFNPPPTDGATIDPLTGEINNEVLGTTYQVMYTTNGTCPITEIHPVTIVDGTVISNVIETCALDELTYTVSFEIQGGDTASYAVVGPGNLIGNVFTSDPIASGLPYDFTATDVNNCAPDNIQGLVNCICPASGTISGDISICPGDTGNLTIDLNGIGPWNITYSIDDINQTPIVTSDNPYILDVVSEGEYELSVLSDANCVGETFGTATVTGLGSPSIINMDETCDLSQLDYTVSFDITGGDILSYNVVGGTGTLFGNTFTSDPILSGSAYDFTVSDANNCATDNTNGNLECICLADVTLSGEEILCPGIPVEVEFNFVGDAPWTFTYAINGIEQTTITTSDNPFLLSTDSVGTFTVIALSDQFCQGTFSGSTVVSAQPQPTAWLNGDFLICNGANQLIPVVLTGTGNWTINYMIDSVLQAPLTALNSPFLFPSTIEGEYLIESVSDMYCENIGDGVANIEFYPPIGMTYSDTASICIGDTAAVHIQANGGLAPLTYTWTGDEILLSVDTAAWLAPELSTSLQLNINDGCSYNQTFDIPVLVHQLPPIDLSGDQFLCGPTEVIINNTTPPEYVGDSCMWIINHLDTMMDCGSVTYAFNNILNYDVYLAVTSPEGCYNDSLFEEYIHIRPQTEPDFSFSPTNPTTADQVVTFYDGSSNSGDFTSTWTFGELGTSMELNPSFEFPVEEGPGSWLVCLATNNIYGCGDSICKLVSIEGEISLMMPNSFTPDGDGLNELFYPVIDGVDEDEYVFRIFNRTGEIVFETRDVNAKWNGVPRQGKSYYSPDGIYNWHIQARAYGSTDREEFKGYILMIR